MKTVPRIIANQEASFDAPENPLAARMKANGYGNDSTHVSKREESARQLVSRSSEMWKLYGQRRKAVFTLLLADLANFE